jgi:hypothetical protein
MSWSINFIGKPDGIVKALEDHSAKLNGASKEEFDAALPHLIALVKENSNKNADCIVKLSGNGHAYFDKGEKQYGTCSVNIEPLQGILL